MEKSFEFLGVSRRWQKRSLFQFMGHSYSSTPKINVRIGVEHIYECKYTFSGDQELYSNVDKPNLAWQSLFKGGNKN